MNSKAIALAAIVVIVGLVVLKNPAASADNFVTPGPNVNAVGVTPNPNILRIPDFWRKQQNEPSAVQATDNPADVIMGFNDCRAADWPEVHGDCWIGVAQSRDFGETWTSRLAPGYNAHPHSIGMGFAADPSFTEIPGNSPGLMLLAYIAGFRDSDQGVIAVQRYVKSPREDGEPFLPEDTFPAILATGSEGRFLDKVASIFIPNQDDPQSSTTEFVNIEGIADSVSVNRLDGVHIVAYSIFTGNARPVKIVSQFSIDGGKTYSNPKKVSDELNTVTGVHLAYLPGVGLSLTYRRSRDSNEFDGIVQALSKNLGRTWSKSETVFDICPHDQQASGQTPRMFTFPWSADSGDRLWIFSADRVDPATGERIFNQGDCNQVAGAPPGTYPGVPRIVGMSSLDGKNWYGSAENPDEPFILDFNNGVGYQMFPFAQGDKNKVNVAFWDTRDEESIRPPPAGEELPLIYDYLTSGGARVFRTANIYMTRITGCKATTPQGACTPHLPTDDGLVAPVKISRYQTAYLNGTLQAVEANRLCLRTHGSGRLCYNGDYGAIGTRRFRRLPSGEVIQNSLGQQPGETTFVPEENILLAWGENRDVFGDFVGNPADPNAQFLYSPPVNAAPGLQSPGLQSDDADSPDSTETPLAIKEMDLKAVGEPDDEAGQGSTADTVVCSAAQNFSYARDSSVYASYVEDKPNMIALAQARQMNTTQRMFPLLISNPGTNQPGANNCLEIANQPPDYGLGRGSGRASFNPLPALNNPDPSEPLSPAQVLLDVLVPPKSSAARSVFVTSSDPTTRITINAYEGMCPPPPEPGQPQVPPDPDDLISSVQVGDGELFDPVFCEENPTNSACQDDQGDPRTVEFDETHNISFATPGLQSPGLQSEVLQAPGLQSLLLGAPGLQSEGLLAPGFQSPGLQSPGLQSPGFQSVTYEANSLISPGLQSPGLQSPGLQSAILDAQEAGTDEVDIYYQDITRTVVANANVTTTYSADIAVLGLEPDETWVQLFAWQPNVHATTGIDPDTGECLALPEADNKVIAAVDMGSPGLQSSGLGDVSLPFAFNFDDQEPYIGDVTFPGKPGDVVNITTRIWVTDTAKDTLDHLYECSTSETPPADCLPHEIEHGVRALVPFGSAAHGCSTEDVGNQDPSVDCISAGAEKIEPPDLFPPVFIPEDGGTVFYEAESPEGAWVPISGTVPEGITVTDADPDFTVFCITQDFMLDQDPTLFKFGDTLVTCMADDTAGNQSNAEIIISVVDTTPPTISVPAAFPATEASSSAGADVHFISQVSADDNTNTTIGCTPTSGSTFPLGTTTVTCEAIDLGGNSDIGTFNVTVSDTIAPTISVPASVAEPAADANGAVVFFAVTADDATNVDILCTQNSGTLFPIGTTPVSCAATDQGGNTDTGTFDVIVSDTGDPQISVPGPITAEAADSNGATVDFVVTASDSIDPNVDIQCTPDSGTNFALGVTTVNCTATDDASNTDTGNFDVTVEDTTPPAFAPALADLTEPATGPDGAAVIFTATATDTVDTAVDVQCTIDTGAMTVESGDIFPVGVTEVTCTASDDGRFGDGVIPPPLNSTTDTFLVTVALGSTDVIPNGNPNNLKTGTSIPFFWAWLDGNDMPVDIGTGNQVFEVRNGTCAAPGNLVFNEDPGSSDFRQKSDFSWQYNFQAVKPNGDDLDAEPGGTTYCAIVILLVDGVAVQQQDGDFKLKP